MPAKIHRKRTSRRSRKNTVRRKNKSLKGRSRPAKSKPKAPAVIANSFFALTLAPKAGFEVQQRIQDSRPEIDPDDYNIMYHDLLACFRIAYQLKYDEPIKFNPLKDGLPIGLSMYHLLESFRIHILPPGFEFNIDRTGKEYFFVIYKVLKNEWIWCSFEIKNIVRALKKKNPGLHSLFIDFIKAFSSHCGIDPWWGDTIGEANWWLSERILNWESYGEPEDQEESDDELQEMKETLHSYEEGEACDYQELITCRETRTCKSLLKSLSKYSRKNPIVPFMYDALELMAEPYNLHSYNYDPMGEDREYSETGVRFPYQAAIIWDDNDHYTAGYTEMLDAAANEGGVFPPIIFTVLTKYHGALDIEWLKAADKWPAKLISLWRSFNKIENAYRPKDKKLKIK